MGLLSSMMEHDCEPSARVDIAPPAQGNTLTLRTVREVALGEVLSICYVAYDLQTDERRRQLLFQHGFHCKCKRCEADAPADAVRWAHGQVLANSERHPELAKYFIDNLAR